MHHIGAFFIYNTMEVYAGEGDGKQINKTTEN